MRGINRNTAAIRRIVRLVAAVVIAYVCSRDLERGSSQDLEREIILSMR